MKKIAQELLAVAGLVRMARAKTAGWQMGSDWKGYSAGRFGYPGDQAIIDALKDSGYSEKQAKWIFQSKHLRWFYEKAQGEIELVIEETIGKEFKKYLDANGTEIEKQLRDSGVGA